MTAALDRRSARLWDRLVQADGYLVVARLTLVTAVANSRDSTWALAVAAIATALLFLDERRLRSPWPWLALAVLLGAPQLREWWHPEDHPIATTYWLVALGLSRFGSRPEDVRRSAARLLLGVIFAFAFGWKLLSSQYMSNDLFRYMLVWDARFEHVAELGGTDVEVLEDERRLAELHALQQEPGAEAPLSEGPRNEQIAWVFTIWGLLIEGAVAVVHLVRLPTRWTALRPMSVFLFCATTYLVLPVGAFGLLLCTLAAAETTSSRIRAAGVVGCAGIAVWSLVFRAVFL